MRDRSKAQAKAEALVRQMTVEEAAGQLTYDAPAIDRLGIPAYNWWNEARHGVARAGTATSFPQAIALAATFDPALVERLGDVAATEGRAKYNEASKRGDRDIYKGLTFWSPNVNIFRDPRWGRGHETYGEDPYLTSRLGCAYVRGLQGDGETMKAAACAKHFAVHSGPESLRHHFNAEATPKDMAETYLPAFKALVQEGQVAEIMCAYQRIDGQPCCSQTRYEQQILRDEWGFQGLITSDCGAIRDFLPSWHNTAKDSEQASAQAVLAGTDVECGSEYRHLPEAVRRGDIKESDLDRSLRRLLIARFEVGDFDSDDLVPWTKIPESVVASAAHKQLALDMARKSIVLLKNDGVLPLDATRSTPSAQLVIMGPNANDSVMQWGNYAGYPTKTVTALEGIRRLLGDVRYVQGCDLTRNESIESRFAEIRNQQGAAGMTAVYYNNTDMQGTPVATVNMTEPVKLSNGGNTVFAPGVSLEHFSARLEGTLVPTRDETLLFAISGDDKLRLLVNGDTLVNLWQARQRIQLAQQEVAVKAGQRYRIQIDYVQEAGYGALNFDIQHKAVPTSQQLLAQVGTAGTVVFVGGISPRLEGEEMRVSEPGFRGGDRTSIELPQAQRDVLRWLHEAGKKVVFVNCSGGAVAMVPELETCDAIIQWWYGGEQGGTALAEVLTGRYNPSGKLPVTFYRSTDDLPDFEDYTMKNRTYRYFTGEPLFAFGHGLSYTTFAFKGLKAKKRAGGDVEVSVTLKNTGKRDGTETVEYYFRRTADTEGPLKTLCGYQQVHLKAGERRTITTVIPRRQLESWDAATNTIRFVSGQYELMAGPSSADRSLLKRNVQL